MDIQLLHILDVSDPTSECFLFNSEELEKTGAWGLFHELGHNMQQDWWSKCKAIHTC